MIIRLATPNDAQQILDIYAPYVEKTDISLEYTVPALEEMERRIKSIGCVYPWIVMEDGSEILGYAYASKYNQRAAYIWSVDVSIYVRESCRGRGVGRALYTSLFMILKHLGYYNAYAIISMSNEKSIAVHEYFGFRKVGHFNNVGYKLGKWLDVGWWELFLQEHDFNPKEPLSIGSAQQSKLIEAFQLGMKVIK